MTSQDELTPISLMELHVATAYRCDAYGRPQAINEPGTDKPAPRFFMGRTQAGNVVRLRDNIPPALARELEQSAAREPLAYDFEDTPREQWSITHALRRHGAVTETYRGPAFTFPTDIASPEGVRLLAPADAHLLHPELFEWVPDVAAGRDCHAAFEDGVAVSICYSSRPGLRAAEAGVETAASYRGRGYAARAVTAWAASIRASGRIPLYGTRWENAASRAVAAKLGLRLFGECWHIQ